MISGVSFTRAARLDLRTAFEWYELQESGLGERLLHEVRAAVNKCVTNPNAYHWVAGPFRKIRIETFPYLIYYSLLEDQLLIQAVFHTSRNPETLKSLLRDGQP